MKQQEYKSSAINIRPPKRQQNTIGSIVEIPVHNEFFCYAQIIPFSNMAFFDYRSTETPKELSIFTQLPILFKLCVYVDIVASGHWMKVGKLPIREDCKKPFDEYVYDKFQDKFYLLHIGGDTSKLYPCTRDEAQGLECAAVWDYGNVEDRLYSFYKGTKCVWLSDEYDLFPNIDPITKRIIHM